MLHQLYLRVYAILSRGAYHPLKRALGNDRAVRFKDRIKVREVMEKVFRKKGYPKMRPSTRRALQAEFKEDIMKLESLIGRDLHGWLK